MKAQKKSIFFCWHSADQIWVSFHGTICCTSSWPMRLAPIVYVSFMQTSLFFCFFCATEFPDAHVHASWISNTLGVKILMLRCMLYLWNILWCNTIICVDIIYTVGHFNVQMSSYQYRNSPHNDKTVSRRSQDIYIYNHIYIYVYIIRTLKRPGPWFNIKMSSCQYRKSHCGDLTTVLSPQWDFLYR